MTSRDVLTANDLHNALEAWLLKTCPEVPVEVVLTALTFELGRIIAKTKPSAADLDAMLATVRCRARLLAARAMQLFVEALEEIPPSDRDALIAWLLNRYAAQGVVSLVKRADECRARIDAYIEGVQRVVSSYPYYETDARWPYEKQIMELEDRRRYLETPSLHAVEQCEKWLAWPFSS